MIVDIEDYTEGKINMDIEREILELYPWIILNLDEIGNTIAYNLFDVEYQIAQKYLDEDINDYLSEIHQRIYEKAVDVLEQNGIDVI